MKVSLVLVLALVFLSFFSCKSITPSPALAQVPVNLPSALTRAKEELKASHFGKAWTLVANQVDSSSEKDQFLLSIQDTFQKERDEAVSQGKLQKAQDLEATLALIKSGNWAPPPLVASNPDKSSPSDWLKGTVTIVVNKGLRVENGSAQPDIVIGSGFFISSDGYLLTNHHVIESEVEPGNSSSSKLSIRLPGSKGERLPAKVVGWDRNLDLALLKTEYKPDYVFTLESGADLIPGQRLQALGSPGGLESTLTEGIVSAVQRPLLSIGEVLQIDVPVNPGNSGGPLVDSQGRVVGVVFAGIKEFQGVNFAIPASLVIKILPRLRVGGKAVLPWVGLALQEDIQGLEVLYVAPQSPADWAGVQVGDRLVGIAGVPVTELAPAQVRLLDFGTDALVPLDLLRDGKPLKLWTTLEPRPDFPLKDAATNNLTARVLPVAFGVVVDDIGSAIDQRFRVKKVWAGTASEELSLSPNDTLEILDWVVDPKNQALLTVWKVKRRLGGYLESVVQMGASFSTRLFL